MLNPRPNWRATGKAMASTANDGNARPRLARLIVTNSALRAWPMYRPSGSATRIAAPTATAETSRCSSTRMGMPALPDQLLASESQAHISVNAFIETSCGAANRPWSEPVFKEHEHPVGEDGQNDR